MVVVMIVVVAKAAASRSCCCCCCILVCGLGGSLLLLVVVVVGCCCQECFVDRSKELCIPFGVFDFDARDTRDPHKLVFSSLDGLGCRTATPLWWLWLWLWLWLLLRLVESIVLGDAPDSGMVRVHCVFGFGVTLTTTSRA